MFKVNALIITVENWLSTLGVAGAKENIPQDLLFELLYILRYEAGVYQTCVVKKEELKFPNSINAANNLFLREETKVDAIKYGLFVEERGKILVITEKFQKILQEAAEMSMKIAA